MGTMVFIEKDWRAEIMGPNETSSWFRRFRRLVLTVYLSIFALWGANWAFIADGHVKIVMHLVLIGMATGLMVIYLVASKRERDDRLKPGHCRNCGYNLFGLRDPRCPECGTVFEPDTNGTDAPTADAKGENGNAKAGHTKT